LYTDGNKSLSFCGENLSTDYSLGDMHLATLHLDDAAGAYRGTDVKFFVQNGSLSMNFSGNNTTEISIGEAECIDLSVRSRNVTVETFCMGGFNMTARDSP